MTSRKKKRKDSKNKRHSAYGNRHNSQMSASSRQRAAAYSSARSQKESSGNVRQTISQLGQSDLQRLKTGGSSMAEYEADASQNRNIYEEYTYSRADDHYAREGRRADQYSENPSRQNDANNHNPDEYRSYARRGLYADEYSDSYNSYDDNRDVYDEYNRHSMTDYDGYTDYYEEYEAYSEPEYEHSEKKSAGEHQRYKKKNSNNKNRRRRRERQKQKAGQTRNRPASRDRSGSRRPEQERRKTVQQKSVKTKNRRKLKRNINRKPIIITMLIFIITAAMVVGIVLFIKYRTFAGYTTTSTLDISNSENAVQYYKYADGYLKCSSNGVTYFDESRIIWSESASMIQPVADICENYIAIADTSEKSVFIYDKAGLVNEIVLNYNVTDVEISKLGVVAVSGSDGDISYLQIFDKSGNEIMVQKSLLSSQGYLMDIAMSDSGTKLAAIFVTVAQGTLDSKVVFYDLSGGEPVTTTFDQYESVLLANVHFLANNIISVVGDTAMSIYSFEESPELVYENSEFEGEIRSLFYSDKYIGMLVENSESDSSYDIKVFDNTGNIQFEMGLEKAYSHIAFAGSNVLMYSDSECEMYSFAGICKFTYRFEESVSALMSANGRDFVYATSGETNIIRLQ